VNTVSDEETLESDKGKKKGKTDYCEVEFGIGNVEFEAKGRSIVVERMFRMLLEKIEEGKLVTEFRLQDIEEEEEEEEEEIEQEEEEVEQEEEAELLEESTFDETDIPEPPSEDISEDPPPAWDSLDSEEPDVSDAEREELGYE
jgi:hypothetical protein